MAKVKISELNKLTEIEGNETTVVEKDGKNFKVEMSLLKETLEIEDIVLVYEGSTLSHIEVTTSDGQVIKSRKENRGVKLSVKEENDTIKVEW